MSTTNLDPKKVLSSLKKDRSYVLSCSGGIDSMVLFELLLINKISFRVIHINYGLRGVESDEDERFVAKKCHAHAIKFECRRMPIDKTKNIQLEARKLRYAWYQEIINESDSSVLLAHHRDDQVETFFMNLMRKSGLAGLSGMPFEHGGIIRPLLEVTKEEIRDYALSKKLVWREDSSNDSLYYVRNSWRNQYLPLIEKEVPAVREAAIILVNCFQRNLSEVRQKTKYVYDKLLRDASMSISEFMEMDADSRFELMRMLGQNQRCLEELLRLRQNGAQLTLKQPAPFISVLKQKNNYVFIRKEKAKHELVIESVDRLPDNFGLDSIYLDAEQIKGSLNLRKPMRGERMHPLGMKGSRLISAIFKEGKINKIERSRMLVLCDEEHVLWIPGIKVSRHALAGKESKQLLRVYVKSSAD